MFKSLVARDEERRRRFRPTGVISGAPEPGETGALPHLALPNPFSPPTVGGVEAATEEGEEQEEKRSRLALRGRVFRADAPRGILEP